jgi:hypothetical protein
MQNEGTRSTMKLNGRSTILLHTFNYVIQEAGSEGSGYNEARHSREFGMCRHTMPAELEIIPVLLKLRAADRRRPATFRENLNYVTQHVVRVTLCCHGYRS